MEASTDPGVGGRAWVDGGIALSNGLTADPLCFIHHCACVRQASNIPHLHQQVASCFKDVDCLVVRDGDKALVVHLQDLITDLKHTITPLLESLHALGRLTYLGYIGYIQHWLHNPYIA